MKDKFLFFDFKKNKLLNLLIIFQIALWLFYVSSLVSLINFNNSYKGRYTRSFPVESSKVMVFYKMIAKESTLEDIEKDKTKVNNIITYMENNKYKYGLIQRDKKAIPLNVIGVTAKALKSNFTEAEGSYNELYPIHMNYGMIESYKKHITGDISLEQWKQNANVIPVILGSNYSKQFKIGDKFQYDNNQYEIRGFLKKDTMSFDRTGIVDSSFLLNGALVIPLEVSKYIENFNCTPITVYFNINNESEVKKFNDGIMHITPDATIKGFNEDLDVFLKELETKRIIEIIRILTISLIATASIATTIYYKIASKKDVIGILYCIGVSKNKIFEMFTSEFSINVAIGIIGGSLFYLKNCKDVYAFFINENLLFNLYCSIFLLLIIIAGVLISGFKKIDKLSPKEMVGGFVE